jgi:2-polyprenyl-3-methyl-5-hydroxy-6-metoxy-1,4-benzoquinol methylase
VALPMESVPCDFCGATEQVNKLSRPIGLEVGECAHCGLAYVNPRPTWQAMLAHYASVYGADTTEAHRTMSRAADPHWADVRRIKRCMDVRGASVLDIGCGSGVFLQTLKQAGASQLVGVEPSAIAAEAARKMLPEAKIVQQPYEEVALGEESFDLVIAANLIEHVYAPGQFLAFAQRVLKSGGYIFLDTPNWGAARRYGSNWRGLQVDYEHVYYFDRITLANYLQHAGFQPVLVDYDVFGGGWGGGTGNGITAVPSSASAASRHCPDCRH